LTYLRVDMCNIKKDFKQIRSERVDC